MPSTLVGVVSDTHGLIRPEALAALAGADLIVHAGDVGGPEVLTALGAIAPVTAVRGNNDRGAWAVNLPASAAFEVAGTWLYLVHDVHELDVDPGAAGFAAVIAGHSHRPAATWQRGVLFLNPGSAGPRRFRLPVSVARLRIVERRVEPELVMLDIAAG